MKFAFKKEWMYFSRTFRLFGVVFSILIFSLADPLLIKGMQFLMNQLQSSEEIRSALPDEDLEAFGLLDNISAEDVSASATGDLTSTAGLIVLLVLMQPCGGEQKKRSVIIPQCAGLTPKRYAVPKFAIYPLTVFASGILASLLCACFSALLFKGGVSVGNAAFSGLAIGLYLAFLVTLELALGICTGRPGLAALITILASQLVPSLLSLIQIGDGSLNRFNPFALVNIASAAAYGKASALNTGVSAGVTVVFGLILFFMTLFVLTARKIENEGNEPVL